MTAKSPATAEAETAIRLGNDTTIDGVAIGDHKLVVELNKALFQEIRHLLEAEKGRRGRGEAGAGQPRGAGSREVRGTCHGTIVKEHSVAR